MQTVMRAGNVLAIIICTAMFPGDAAARSLWLIFDIIMIAIASYVVITD